MTVEVPSWFLNFIQGSHRLEKFLNIQSFLEDLENLIRLEK